MEALKSLSSRARKRWTHQRSVQFQEPTHIHLNYASYPEESSKNLMKAGKFPNFQGQLLRKKHKIKNVIIPLEVLIPLVVITKKTDGSSEIPKFQSSEEVDSPGKRQFQEPTHIHLNYASYPEVSSKNLMKFRKFPYFQRELLRMMSQYFHPKDNIVGNKKHMFPC